MWRVLLVALLVSGCGDSHATPDAAVDSAIDAVSVLRTAPFTLLLCTAGNPGDATCPFNQVALDELGPIAAGARVRFIAQPLAQDLYLTQLRIDSVRRVHLLDLSIERADGTGSTLLVESIETGMTETAGAALSFTPTGQYVLRVAVIY